MTEIRSLTDPLDDPAVDAAAALLAAGGLPTEDLRSGGVALWGCSDADGLRAAVGLERHGTAALLRSLVVADRARGLGLGRAMAAHAEAEAASAGASAVYLLTETAETFFERLGYDVVDRAAVPDAIRNTAQFASLCPASAAVLRKRLSGV